MRQHFSSYHYPQWLRLMAAILLALVGLVLVNVTMAQSDASHAIDQLTSPTTKQREAETIELTTESAGAATGGIAGFVTAPDGRSLEGIVVMTHKPQPWGWEIVQSAVTDPSGHYLISALETDIYRLYFLDPAGTYVSKFYSHAMNVVQVANIPVSGDLIPDINVVLSAREQSSSLKSTFVSEIEVLFTIPEEIEVSFQVSRDFEQPMTEFQIGESVNLMLNGERLRGGSFPPIASDVTFVISNDAGEVVWSHAVGPVGEGWSSGSGGGWGVGVSWGQVDSLGSPVPPGNYYAGILLTEPTYDVPVDYSGAIALSIINGVSVFVHSDVNLGSGAIALAAGDINNDSYVDLIFGNEDNQVYLNNGNGTFTYSYSFSDSSAGHGRSLELADLDGDGDLDLVEGILGYPRGHPNTEVRTYENDGTGLFSQPTVTLLSRPPTSYWDSSQFLTLGDIDNDQDLDIIVSLVDSSSVEIYYNDGDSNFNISSQVISSQYVHTSALGDIDDDGDLDIILGNSENVPNKVLLNNGSGYFTDTGQSLGGSYTYHVALGDIDNDNDLDLIAGNISDPQKVYQNDGQGNFSLWYELGTPNGYSHPMVLGDIDSDQDLDLITAGDRTYVYVNDGEGQLVESEGSLQGTSGLNGDTSLIDVDNDQDLDLVTAGWENKLYPNVSNTNTATNTVILELTPLTVTTGYQETFEVPILVQAGTQEVDGVTAHLNFDPAQLEVVSITPGSEFSAVILNQFDNQSGQLDFAAGSFNNFPSGTFTLATVTVRTTALTDEDGTPVEFNSSLPRLSDASFDGISVLSATIDSTVFVEKMVVMALSPPTLTTSVGETFELPILVQAGTQPVDGAAAGLTFDPTRLEVASITAGSDLPNVLANSFDNDSGQLEFAAGTLNAPFPSGTFTLATVTFNAIEATAGTDIDFALASDATFDGTSVLKSTSGSTVTILNAVLTGSVTLQGRPTPPDSGWVVPLRVSLTIPGEDTPAYEFTPTTDESGTFTITSGITPGTYEIRVKNSHTLQNKQTVTLTGGNNSIDFGELREGDANDDNYVTLIDFSILVDTFAKCEGDTDYNAQADFNGDTCVTILDFSLLASNFAQEGQHRPQASAPTTQVAMSISPAEASIKPGESFKVTVRLDAGEQQVDGAQIGLNFDPAMLAVEEVMIGDKLTLELANQVDNESGTIQFAAGTFEEFPEGEIDVMTIQLRALQAGSTALAFGLDGAMGSDVTFAGASVLGSHADGTVTVSEPTAVRIQELAAPATASWLWAFAPLALTLLAGAFIMRRRQEN